MWSIKNPLPFITNQTLAVVSIAPVAKPAASQANEKAIVKHAACAAANSSSGLVPRQFFTFGCRPGPNVHWSTDDLPVTDTGKVVPRFDARRSTTALGAVMPRRDRRQETHLAQLGDADREEYQS